MNTQMKRCLVRSGKVSRTEFLSVELGCTTLTAYHPVDVVVLFS